MYLVDYYLFNKFWKTNPKLMDQDGFLAVVAIWLTVIIYIIKYFFIFLNNFLLTSVAIANQNFIRK